MSTSICTCPSALPTLRPALCQLSSPTLCAKVFANFPAQCAPLDLNLGPFPAQYTPLDLNLGSAQLSMHRWTSTVGPAQLSMHRWTSTWDLPSSMYTAGPQPGICPAQYAPLDLNLGPAQLSVHRWTSTGR